MKDDSTIIPPFTLLLGRTGSPHLVVVDRLHVLAGALATLACQDGVLTVLVRSAVCRLVSPCHPPGEGAVVLGAGTGGITSTLAFRNTICYSSTLLCLLFVGTQVVLTFALVAKSLVTVKVLAVFINRAVRLT